MTPEELLAAIASAVKAHNCAGMELTIYDPTLDTGAEGRTALVASTARSGSESRFHSTAALSGGSIA
jgi:arginase family enzyme